jgi:hypothetical protein
MLPVANPRMKTLERGRRMGYGSAKKQKARGFKQATREAKRQLKCGYETSHA